MDMDQPPCLRQSSTKDVSKAQSGGIQSASKLGFKKSQTIIERGSKMGGIGSKFGLQRTNSLSKGGLNFGN